MVTGAKRIAGGKTHAQEFLSTPLPTHPTVTTTPSSIMVFHYSVETGNTAKCVARSYAKCCEIN